MADLPGYVGLQPDLLSLDDTPDPSEQSGALTGSDSSDDGSTDALPPPMLGASLRAMSAKYPEAGSVHDAYEAAINQLKAQRAGLTGKEKLAALLIGFGKPTPGGFGNQLSNAAQNLLAQKGLADKRDDARNALLAKYMSDEGVKVTAAAQAAEKAAAANGPKTTIGVAANGAAYRKTDNPDGSGIVDFGNGRVIKFNSPTSDPTATSASAAPTAPAGTQISDFAGQSGVSGKNLGSGFNPDLNYDVPMNGNPPTVTAGQEAAIAGQRASAEQKAKAADDPLAQYNGLTGQPLLDAMRTNSPGDYAMVTGMSRGAVAPPNAGTRSAAAQRILQLAESAYPNTDFGKVYKTVTDFSSSGKAGQNIIKGATAIDHLGQMYDAATKLDNVDLGGIPLVGGPLTSAINGAKNATQGSVNPAIGIFRQNRQLYTNELQSAIKASGSNPSLAEFNEFQKNLNDANSAPVLQGVMAHGAELLGERLQEQVKPYNDTMGTNRTFLSFLPTATAQQFMRINPQYQYNADDKQFLAEQEAAKRQRNGGGAPVSPASAKGGAAIPEATLNQYKAVPMANKAAARQRLQQAGYDVSGLN